MIRGVVVAPLRLDKNKKGDKWSVNLNQYRNTHYQTLNNMKRKYKELLAPQINLLPNFSKIRLVINIYAADNRKFDIGNLGSVHEKFFLDALVELGKLPDDTYEYCPETHTFFMGIDKQCPRVEIIIEELRVFQINKPDRIPVDITTTEYDLVELIKAEIAKADPTIDVEDVRLVGLEAIEIDAFVGEAKKKTTRKKAAKAEPKVEPKVEPEVLDEVVAAKEEEAEKPVETADDIPFPLDDVADPEADSQALNFADQEMSLIDEVLAEEANDVSINELSFETDEPKESKSGTTVADIFGN